MRRRHDLRERLDEGSYSPKEYRRCLEQLEKIGQLPGGDRAIFEAIDPLPPIQKLLDVGCGGGSLARALARRYPQAEVVGIDLAQEAVEVASSYSNPQNLRFQRARWEEIDPSDYDLITSSLMLHHLSDEEILAFLQWTSAASGHVILNDLHRHPLAWLLFAAMAPICFPSRLIFHDGLRSIRRAFTRRELRSYLEKAKLLHQSKIEWKVGFRWIVTIASSEAGLQALHSPTP